MFSSKGYLFDPVVLVPITCMYQNAPLINIPLSAVACIELIQSLVATGAPIYFSLFIYRHK
ncbi:hypothetical protein PRIPAC_84602, partial [Pristionchus pacificus]|uniref:Uncharacterized protein n=1 Tax=Pristionchus pacificus TaxID=54126 RepID=A0A2A6BLE1_PRIPA